MLPATIANNPSLSEYFRYQEINKAGLIGLGSIIAVAMMEIATLVSTPEGSERRSEGSEIVVTEVANFWVGSSFALTVVFVSLNILQAIDTSTTDYSDYADVIFPVVLLTYAMSVLLKPLRTDKPYSRYFLYSHFLLQALVTNIAMFIGRPKAYYFRHAIYSLVRLLIYFLTFITVLRLRRTSAFLPPPSLSRFLVTTVFARGTMCLATAIFFSMEVVSCWQQEDDDTLCWNTQSAATHLSGILTITTLTSFALKTVPPIVRDEASISKEQLATFEISGPKKVQFLW